MLSSTTACEALRQGKCLQINYSGFSRVVEVHAVDGVLGLAGSTSWKVRWLRFRLTMERGPHERPQASEEKRSHETLCRVGRVDKRDQCLHRG
jgi:hypothetical protein